ncbi:Vacuolar protein sorting-associated protein 13B [Collichthys lucidus]|uniref:Vacuolar protein sorting-associated protein 13B n=1 Tax=Collichthys lucidus TaxID=240159 RepID=A0A4U5V343_COLLU|nr:Vacuolar protein sorting-associated protein 13B [Collichthys lucidus]
MNPRQKEGERGGCRMTRKGGGGVLLVSVQGIAVNVDPVFCTWLLYQPHRGSSRQQQQTPGSVTLAKRREDEVSVGSTPLAKQPSNQASDYASSPVKTKTVTESRPLSIPMKVMPDTTEEESWTTSEERMKELIAHAWDAVKRLTLQFAEPVIASTFPLSPSAVRLGPHHVLQQ